MVRMVATNEVPKMVVAEGTVGALRIHRWAKKGHVKLSVKDQRKLLLEKLKLSGLDSWTEENKEKGLKPSSGIQRYLCSRRQRDGVYQNCRA